MGKTFSEGAEYTLKMRLFNYKFLEHRLSPVQGFRMALAQEFSKNGCNFLRISSVLLDNDELILRFPRELAV